MRGAIRQQQHSIDEAAMMEKGLLNSSPPLFFFAFFDHSKRGLKVLHVSAADLAAFTFPGEEASFGGATHIRVLKELS